METLKIDTGVREFRINARGVLRFNPTDPNLFQRLQEASRELETVEAELTDGRDELSGMVEADRKLKAMLTRVFGEENDFDKLLGGVNLLSVGENGQRVIENLLETLAPVLQEGAAACGRSLAEKIRKEQGL